MGLLDELKKLTRPYDDDDEEMEFEDTAPAQAAPQAAPRESAPARSTPGSSGTASSARRSSFSPSYSDYETSRPTQVPRRDNKVVNINTTAQLKVVLVKPERFETAAEIADHLREKRTVVMNLEQANKEVARRLIDFLSGVAYALEGKIKKVAVSTYIITPYNVDIMGDLIDELENNGLYF